MLINNSKIVENFWKNSCIGFRFQPAKKASFTKRGSDLFYNTIDSIYNATNSFVAANFFFLRSSRRNKILCLNLIQRS